MIAVRFSVRPGQGEPSGFDLGDIVCEGESGSVRSADRGLMVHLSVALLLDDLRPLLFGKRQNVSFSGVDMSVRIDFERVGKGLVSVSSRGVPVGRVRVEDLARVFLRAAEELAEQGLSSLPEGDGVRIDYSTAVRKFRAAGA
ncbi:hypothetical protein ACIPQA_29430 [Streptomyces sp. NPDC090109]|uniref:hypothetical protein n=1 Tax=unclassified Streptomyces TaxID=2593676 RepID=UPI0036EC6D50